MVKPVPLRQLLDELQPRKLLEQRLPGSSIPNLVGDALQRFSSACLRVLGAEQVGGLVGTDAGLVDGAGQHQRDLVEELVAVRQPAGVPDRPEPQRAPVVHHQLQAAVGAGPSGCRR